MTKVLTIDGDITPLSTMTASFARDFETFSAPDGRRGLKRFEAQQPDLVVTDIVMPEIEGVAVIGADDRIEYCNAIYPRLWGIPARGLTDGPRSADPEHGRALMNGILFRQDAVRIRNVVRLGDGRCLELVKVAARDSSGPGLRRVMFVRDVTPAQGPAALQDRALFYVAAVLAVVVLTLAALPKPGRTTLARADGAFAVAALEVH